MPERDNWSTQGLAALDFGTGAVYDQLTMWQQNQAQENFMELEQQNNMELMNQAQQNQYALNVQGQQLQMDMWNQTNYGAQMEHMRKAGLNPALMYGKGAGQGGTTGSQTGGQAAKGNAGLGQAARSQGGKMELAQANLMEAQANDLQSQTNKRDGIDTLEAEARETGLRASTIETIQRTTNLKTENEIQNFKKQLEAMRVQRGLKGTMQGDLLGNVMELAGMDPVNNWYDRVQLKTMVYTWFGAKIGSDIMNMVTKGKWGIFPGKGKKNTTTDGVEFPYGNYQRGTQPQYGTPPKSIGNNYSNSGKWMGLQQQKFGDNY